MKPQDLLAEMSNGVNRQNMDWVNNYKNLPAKVQKDLDMYFFKVGELFESYERRIVAINSPFDKFARKLQNSNKVEKAFNSKFSKHELEGFKIFLSAGCTNCHFGGNFTDNGFHNIGLPWHLDEIQWGRSLGMMKIKKSPLSCEKLKRKSSSEEACMELKYLDLEQYETVGSFKTPSLRNLSKTAPYMHHGIYSSIDEVIEHYNKLDTTPAIGHTEESFKPLGLTESQKHDLKAFLNSLNSKTEEKL